MEKNNCLGLLFFRIGIAGLMLFHGIAKINSGIDFLVDQMGVFAYAVYIGEVIAPILILLGWRTRLASLVLAINCIVAIGFAHSNEIFSLNDHGAYANELITLYLLGAIGLFFTGAGNYAISKTNKWD
jgi:putative oxidoreductase